MAFFDFLNTPTSSSTTTSGTPQNDSGIPSNNSALPTGNNSAPNPTSNTAPITTDTAGKTTQQGQQGTPNQYTNLWEGDITNATLGEGLNLNITAEQLIPIAQKLDYTQQIPDELKQKVMSGGADAVAAIMEISNIVGRANYIHSTMSNAKVLETAIQKANENLEAKMNDKLRAYGLNEAVVGTNPALNNPAIKPMVDMVQSRILQKFPNASKQELATMTNEYFTTQLAPAFGMGANVAPTGGGASTKADIDWQHFFSS